MNFTIIIPTLNAATELDRCLKAVAGHADLLIADGGSTDATCARAATFGATVISASRGRGTQLRAGAAAARTDWMLFLHADTILDASWRDEVNAHMRRGLAETAAVFQFALDHPSPAARRLERLVALRGRALGLPYGDQGLLIHRALYDQIGGYTDIPLMEDVDIVRRIGKRRLTVLDARATTSAVRWQQSGWLWRSARNLICLGLYFAGVSPATLVKFYGR